LLAFWNSFAPETFKTFFDSMGLKEYSQAVFGLPVRPTIDRYALGGLEYVRAGSVFLFPVTLAYYLLLPVGLVIGRTARGTARAGHVIAGIVCTGGLVLTLTRSAIAAVPFMFVLASLVGRKRASLFVLLVACFALAVPVLGATAGAERLNLGGNEASTSSTNDHVRQLRASVDRVKSTPLGSGLGTAGGISRRFDVTGSIVNDSWYLQVGTELGVFGMMLYIVVLLGVLRALWRAAAQRPYEAVGPLCALAGISLGGLVLHTLEEFSVAWPVWLLAGLSLRGTSEGVVEEGSPDAFAPALVSAQRGNRGEA
jgi:hypothetical protein